MLVLDATPLIYLATVDRLNVLDAREEACSVPPPVCDERVTECLEAGHVDARRVEQAVGSGTLSVRPAPETELADRLGENQNLTKADVAVIALAASEDGVDVLDDRYGQATARTEGVEIRGTAACSVKLWDGSPARKRPTGSTPWSMPAGTAPRTSIPASSGRSAS